MPVHFAHGNLYNVSNLEFLRLFAFGADEAHVECDGQDLVSLMSVPESTRPRP